MKSKNILRTLLGFIFFTLGCTDFKINEHSSQKSDVEDISDSVKMLLKKGNIQTNNNLDSAFNYYQKAYDVSIQNSYIPGVQKSLDNLLRLHYLTGNFAIINKFEASIKSQLKGDSLQQILPFVWYYQAKSFFFHAQYDSSDYYSRLVLKGAEKYNMLDLYTRALLRISKIHRKFRNMDSVKIYLSLVEQKIKNNFNESAFRDLLWHKSIYHGIQQQYDSSFFFLHKAYEISDRLRDSISMSGILTTFSSIEKNKGNYKKAMQHIFHSIQMIDQLNCEYILANRYSKLGDVLNDLDEYDQASYYYNKSLEIYQESDMISSLPLIKVKLGGIYIRKKEYNIASQYIKEAIDLFQQTGQQMGVASAYHNMGLLQYKNKKYKKALQAYIKCLQIYDSLDYTSQVYPIFNNIGATFFFLGDYHKALEYYFKTLEKAKKKSDKEYLWRSYFNISEAYEYLGQHKKALKYYKQYVSVKDRILDETKTRQIAEMREKYETGQKEKTIKIQQLEISQTRFQRNVGYGAVAGLLLLALLIISYILHKRKTERALLLQDKKIKEQEIDKLVKESEIKTINSRLDGEEKERQRLSKELHDNIGGTMSLIMMNFEQLAGHVRELKNGAFTENLGRLKSLYQEVRDISHQLGGSVLFRFGLVPALEDLVNSVNNSARLHIELYIFGKAVKMDQEKETSIFRIVQEIITNAMKHAQAKTLFLQFNFSEEDQTVDITAEDDGKGFDVSSKRLSGSMGLENIKNRVNGLNGHLSIESEKDTGTTFIISDIPFNSRSAVSIHQTV